MSNKLHGIFGLSGAVFKTGGFLGTIDHIARIEMPETFKGIGIQKSKKDLEMVSKMLSDHPEESGELLDAVIQNRMTDALKIADQLGLREHKFIAEGGGLVWLVAVAVVVAVVLVSHDAE